MADLRGFLTLRRATPRRQAVQSRLEHWREFYEPLPEPDLKEQGARCMDCGVPFCQGDTGCPVGNVIPEWNELVRGGHWEEAAEALHATNNFPELTGRLCPAPCESACVLGLIDQPVTIRSIEQSIADRALLNKWIAPRTPRVETGKRVAVIGSGPAGLAAAQQLRRKGHTVVVFERSTRVGGLLRYGIPDFKLEKWVLDQRIRQLAAEGIVFRTGVEAGVDVTVDELRAEFHAICVAVGASHARDLDVPGRELDGVHLAMDFLSQQNRRIAGESIGAVAPIDARAKRVVIIGGGDTGSDCAGTCLRQGARSVRQFELLPQPPAERSPDTPWPLWPMQLRTSHSHEEGCEREWSVSTTRFAGSGGTVQAVHATRVQMRTTDDGHTRFDRIAGTDFTMKADLVLLAMGFAGPAKSPLLAALGVQFDKRGNVASSLQHATDVPGVFVAGDARRGASLIVWAIREGRDAATSIDRYLMAT